jgi:FkbM family methyltransferase
MLLARLWRKPRLTAADMQYAKLYFSQYGEDIIVRALFPRSHIGFYVDVGAHHPSRFSNTALLYRRGWRGINIEPCQEAIALFERERKDDVNLCLAVAGQAGEMEYEIYAGRGTFNRLADASIDVAGAAGIGPPAARRRVRTEALGTILGQHVPTGKNVDFLNVDCEGMDLAVLESNDWQRFLPRVIAVEDWQDDAESEIRKFMQARGYRQVGLTQRTRIFKRDGSSL